MNIREWTLPVYTILTQLSVGALCVIWIIRTLRSVKLADENNDQFVKVPVLILFFTIAFAIIFAHFHLSKPFLSVMALRNIETSWLSRELLANTIYIFFVGLLLVSLLLAKGSQKTNTFLGWTAIVAGFATDYCMSRIYLLPSQPSWNSPLTPVSFLVTTFLLGVVTVPVLFIMDLIFKKSQEHENLSRYADLIGTSLVRLAVVTVPLCILMAGINFYQIASLLSGSSAAQTSLSLLLNIYQPLLIIRLVLLFVGVVWFVYISVQINQRKLFVDDLLPNVFIVCLLVMIAEILGRFLFYAIHVRVGI